MTHQLKPGKLIQIKRTGYSIFEKPEDVTPSGLPPYTGINLFPMFQNKQNVAVEEPDCILKQSGYVMFIEEIETPFQAPAPLWNLAVIVQPSRPKTLYKVIYLSKVGYIHPDALEEPQPITVEPYPIVINPINFPTYPNPITVTPDWTVYPSNTFTLPNTQGLEIKLTDAYITTDNTLKLTCTTVVPSPMNYIDISIVA
jgi:hypothetical protein